MCIRDRFYYVWLKVLMDWPRTWLEWDVLFLIPSVWLGPWICPAAISVLFIVWGSWALMTKRNVKFSVASLTTFVIGAVLGLVSFMQPAIGAGAELNTYLPGSFWWWLFIPSYLLMVLGFAMTAFFDPRLSKNETTPN